MSKFSQNLEAAFSQYPQLTLRQLALHLGISYQQLITVSHRPIPGVPYDPVAVNWDAVSDTLEKKGVTELPDLAAIADSKKSMYPSPKDTKWNVGDLVQLKYEASVTNEDTTYEIVFMTATHIVFMDVDGTQPRVMNYGVFNHQGPARVKAAE